VTDSDTDPLSRPLRPEVIPEDWLRAIENCTSSPSITIITGSSSSGKSTFARRLVNRSLTGLGKNAPSVPAVCYMDLDPKRQEYAPGGQISLVVARDLNLSPSFTHPSIIPASGDAMRNEMIRSHPIPMDFANYADYYQSCVEDLFLAYRNLCSRDPSLPLVIDTPGFLYTSNFDIINKLLTRLKPHNIVHLGDTQAYDTETAARLHLLQTTASQYRSTVQEITAQQPQSIPIRTDAELSAMQMQSYFHLKPSTTNPDQPQVLSWTPDTLSHLVPWEFCYDETSERTQDIVGFATYSESIEPASLLHALNGSIVQIIQSTSSTVPTPYTSLPRTGKHSIPYFPESERTGKVEPLDPRTTRLVCTAMIRGFDLERKVVQVLVPKTHDALLYDLVPERTVFVGGCCDVPEWAFVEDAYAKKGAGSHEQPGLTTEFVDHMPWVESEGVIEEMGYLNTVRRVRKYYET
jgi:polynucleotide 5'-hydroxyl-kinase GRC3/NOL9